MNPETTPETSEVIERFFAALTQRDLEAATALFAEEVDWHIPGDAKRAPWTGRRSTREEVARFYELLWKNTEPLSVDVRHLFVQGDAAVITGRFSSRMLATGKVLDSMFFIEIEVRAGKIVRYYLLEDTLAVFLALNPE